MNSQGVEFRMLSVQEVRKRIPVLAPLKNCRLPILGGSVQERAGIARHDAIVWGYARAADAYGVDIIENTDINAIRRGKNGEVTGVETNRGFMKAGKVAVAAGGDNTAVASLVDFKASGSNIQFASLRIRADQTGTGCCRKLPGSGCVSESFGQG